MRKWLTGGMNMNFMDFSSDKIDIFLLVIDRSGSMDGEENKVREGLKLYKKSFENFPEANSIAVSISTFSNDFYPGEFRIVSDMTTSYETGGATALYYSIIEGYKYLRDYIEEVTEKTGVIPRATFIFWSDGEPCKDRATRGAAKEAIERMNLAQINTVFVAFGNAIKEKFGRDMGFVSTIEVTDKSKLVEFLGVELSRSCKEQSQSIKALGANFFSQAVGDSDSEEYSNTTAQALEDDSWIDDI